MKKDVFADWLRELCMLVFIQTIQAFIFAIVMSLIISLLSGFPVDDESDAVASTGVIAVIVLASVSKIEDIVKKIFGIKSGFHDSGMRGGLKSLATTMMAANMAKGVLDNGRKVLGGAIGAAAAPIKANKDMNQARARLARDMNRYGGKPGIQAGAGAAGSPLPAGSSESGSSTSTPPAPTNPASAPAAASAGAAGGSSANDKLQDRIEAYNDKIAEIKANRGKAIRNSSITALSGLAETAGAIGFGAVGMTAGAAMGEGKEIVQAGLIGAGMGDKIGNLSVKPIKAASDLQNFAAENRAVNKELIKQTNMLNETKGNIRRVRQAKKELQRQLDNLDAGNID